MVWRRFLLCLSLAVNALLLYRFVWGTNGLVDYQSLKKQGKMLEQRISELDKANLALSREIRLLQSDDKYNEKMIRKRLNFVKDNEILYLFPDAQEAARPGAGPDEGKN